MVSERHGYFDKEMQLLETFVGKEIKCVYLKKGETILEGIKGILKNVDSYDSIKVDDYCFSFLGELSTIIGIADSDNNIIYRNDKIPVKAFQENYPKYYYELMDLMQDQKEYLGYSVKQEGISNSRK